MHMLTSTHTHMQTQRHTHMQRQRHTHMQRQRHTKTTRTCTRKDTPRRWAARATAELGRLAPVTADIGRLVVAPNVDACSTCVTWLIHICDLWHGSFMWVVCLIYMYKTTHWLLRLLTMLAVLVLHDSFISVTWRIHMSDMLESCE